MKKILSMLLVFAMMFGLLACGASKPAETQASTEASTEAPTSPARLSTTKERYRFLKERLPTTRCSTPTPLSP